MQVDELTAQIQGIGFLDIDKSITLEGNSVKAYNSQFTGLLPKSNSCGYNHL